MSSSVRGIAGGLAELRPLVVVRRQLVVVRVILVHRLPLLHSFQPRCYFHLPERRQTLERSITLYCWQFVRGFARAVRHLTPDPGAFCIPNVCVPRCIVYLVTTASRDVIDFRL
jgi:hypothetical protein